MTPVLATHTHTHTPHTHTPHTHTHTRHGTHGDRPGGGGTRRVKKLKAMRRKRSMGT